MSYLYGKVLQGSVAMNLALPGIYVAYHCEAYTSQPSAFFSATSPFSCDASRLPIAST